ISAIAKHLDLNSLHELSRTCRQIREALLQNRRLLVRQALRCENDTANSRGMVCARDLVGECRKCGTVVCRNCVVKTTKSDLNGRYRRLCRTCLKAPLERLSRSETSQIQTNIAQTPCMCVERGIWLCRACGQALNTADRQYWRGWLWRTKYSQCGGFGTGLGERQVGVECGRGSDCLAATTMEHEIEVDDEAVSAEAEAAHRRHGNSYTTQEVEGIGGLIKMKMKKQVLVGAAVEEYNDERDGGINRSWCSWCDGVVAETRG
ncbi:hypothetical protein K470DRAFT_215346, partial [Piedraia hortae CBS 480.64]